MDFVLFFVVDVVFIISLLLKLVLNPVKACSKLIGGLLLIDQIDTSLY